MTGKELEKIANENKKVEVGFWGDSPFVYDNYDWQAIANELNQRIEITSMQVCEAITDTMRDRDYNTLDDLDLISIANTLNNLWIVIDYLTL